jgi:hypothetical protein
VRIAPDRRARLAAEEEGVEWRRRWVDLAVGRRAKAKSEQRDAQAREGEVDECGWTMEAMGTFGWEVG